MIANLEAFPRASICLSLAIGFEGDRARWTASWREPAALLPPSLCVLEAISCALSS
jgi:hypothetical protein